MYRDTLGVDFPPGIAELLKAVSKRHDIVHRNCKDKSGAAFEVTSVELTALLDLAAGFISELSKRLDARGADKPSSSSP